MKIENFSKKQMAQPVALGLKGKPDTGCSKKPLEPASRDNDIRLMVDVGYHKASETPQEEHSNVDREMKPSSAATELRPFSEATNRQLTAAATPKRHLEKPAAQVSAIDLCDSPSPAARPAQQGELRTETPIVLATAAQEQIQGDAMDVDAPGSPVQKLSDAATGLTGSEQRPEPQQLGPATGAEPVTPQVILKTGSSEAPPGSAAINTSTAKVSQEAFLSPDQRKQLLQDCLQELPLLEAELDKRPDFSSCSLECSNSSKKGGQLDLKHQVSILVEGQSLPLSQLAQQISSTLSTLSSTGSGAGIPAADVSVTAEAGTSSSQAAAEPHGAAAGGVNRDAASVLVVRNVIQDVASRKSYGLQDGALAPVDAFEDVTATYHWCWELRSLTGLPKTIKQQADIARKHRKQVLEWLKACSAYIQLAQGFTKSTKTAEQKIAKAAAKLNKLQSLQDLQVVATAAAEAAELSRQDIAAAAQEKAARKEQAVKAASAKAEKARLAEDDKAAKETERAAKEAEKAAKVAAKAAEAEEKARQKAEEDRKREEARQQKAAEEARKKEEKAKLKEEKKAAKKGFHSAQEMQKSQKVFMSFLKKEPRPAAPPSGPSADNSHGQSGSQQQHQQPFEPVGGGGGPSEQQVALMQQLDQELPVSSRSSGPRPVPELLAMLMRHWKTLGKKRHRSWGLPPSWARRPGAASDPDHIAATAEALYGEGIDLSTLRCWRRKLIKHNDSVRSAYYGSWSRQSRCVSGRKPFGQDVEVDYEVMSDQDWEEEPEGESLSNDGEDDEEAAADEVEEDEEGFVVGDGYLSEDEGLRDEDGDTVVVPTAGACPDVDKDPIEAAQERAKARGRYVVLAVNDIVPNLTWEPTTNLDPAQLLASLQATVFTPEITPLQPWEHLAVQIHGRPASAALARAASPDAACCTALAAADPDAAAAAAVAASTGGASGPGRRQSMFPDDMRGALVQHIQGNSTVGIDKLTDQFVESLHGACFTGKLTKKSVRDKIRQVTTLKKGRTPCYAVKPEYVAAVGAAAAGGVSPTAKNVPTGVWGVKYKEEAATETPAASPADDATAADAVAVENAGDVHEQQQQIAAQQQQQPEAQHAPDLSAPSLAQAPPAAVPTAVTGVKRPASAHTGTSGVVAPTAQTPATTAAPQQQSTQPTPAAAAAAADVPPAKKQKTPGGGIERFFFRPKQKAQQQQLEQVDPMAAPGSREQQDEQQEQQTPPTTPKHAVQASADAGATEDCPAAAAAHGNHSGVLPMLTPPSVDAADRPALPHSPVPFRMNAAATGGDESTEKPQQHSPQQQRAPINRWHAQADCRGMSLQGGSTSSMPQQQQEQQQQQPQSEQQNSDQPFGGFDQQQQSGQQQQQDPSFAFTKASDLLGNGAGPANAASPGNLAKPALQVPQLPEDGSAPDSRFWKQLSSWIVCVREPSQDDIDTALAVFGEQHLEQCIHSMPQAVMAAIVKSLGSYSQSLPMRAACARCISNVAQCLASKQQQTQQAGTSTPQKAGPSSPAAAAGGPIPSPGPSPSPAVATASLSPSLKRKFAASPSPSTSPRSAPLAVSFAELCAEPLLLSNLLLSAREPSGQLDDISKRVGEGAGGTLEEATELSRKALRAVAALTGAGLPHPLTGSKDFCPAAAAAAAEVRLRIASTASWRGVFMAAVGGNRTIFSSPDRSRSTFALMALHHVLSDTAAASQLLNKALFSKRLAKCVMKRGADAREWVVRKWTLLVSSLLLTDELYQSWILPTDGLNQFHQHKKDDEEIVAALGLLLAGCINRPEAKLSEPGADRILLGKSLTLTNLLGQQIRIPGNNGRLPNSVASLVGGGFAGSGQEEGVLVGALKEVAMQDDWEEAAVRARHILESLGSASAGQDMEMEDAIPG